jgi:hypothetical protein
LFSRRRDDHGERTRRYLSRGEHGHRPGTGCRSGGVRPGAGQQAGCRAGVLILVAGIAGGILHTGLFFVPALVALAVGGVKLWRERP